ncbi:hypothetical protein [Streptomyces sp. NPDC051218]|uniref:hypothetical protein n=1 Tax=Streptomyces sp. NPDC051218 TaxID=3365645 RepID=UPI00378D91BF
MAELLAGDGASEPWDARWNYAYFPPSALEGVRVIGHDPDHDPVGAELQRSEAAAQGLWYENEDEGEDEDEERGDALMEEFHAVCVDVARRLHTDGHLVGALGRPLPVILYDMSDPDEMFALTRAANPPELVAEFLSEDPQGESGSLTRT